MQPASWLVILDTQPAPEEIHGATKLEVTLRLVERWLRSPDSPDARLYAVYEDGSRRHIGTLANHLTYRDKTAVWEHDGPFRRWYDPDLLWEAEIRFKRGWDYAWFCEWLNGERDDRPPHRKADGSIIPDPDPRDSSCL